MRTSLAFPSVMHLASDLLPRCLTCSVRGVHMPGRYCHVIFRDGAWHLYSGDSAFPLMVDENKSAVVKAARSRARQYGMKVIIHRAPDEEEKRPGRP